MIYLIVLIQLTAATSFMVDDAIPLQSDSTSCIGGFSWRLTMVKSDGRVSLFVPWALTDVCITELRKGIDKVTRHHSYEMVLEMGWHPFLPSYTDENLLRIKQAFDKRACRHKSEKVPISGSNPNPPTSSEPSLPPLF